VNQQVWYCCFCNSEEIYVALLNDYLVNDHFARRNKTSHNVSIFNMDNIKKFILNNMRRKIFVEHKFRINGELITIFEDYAQEIYEFHSQYSDLL